MDNVLAKIIDEKHDEVAHLAAHNSFADLHQAAQAASKPRGFVAALETASRTGYGLIAELKKASPSKGLIRADFDPASLACAYQQGGASCLSVLTDRNWFHGEPEFLVAALIMAALEDDAAAELESCAFEYDMDVLIECHDNAEIERAKKLKSQLIGINNRNLKTMEISLDVGEAMLPHLPADRIAVAESGLFYPADLARMAVIGARCFLIGESLMRADDVAGATAAILANPVGVPARAG